MDEGFGTAFRPLFKLSFLLASLIAAVYQKPIESQAELECGTSSGNRFAVGGSLHASQCSKNQYLCGEVGQPFEQCLIMTDCEMHTNMAIDVPYTNTSRFATFARQMIPHHKNAVAMSKILLKVRMVPPLAASVRQSNPFLAHLAHRSFRDMGKHGGKITPNTCTLSITNPLVLTLPRTLSTR